MSGLWPWLGLFGLGAYHGVNPGMGWLFAVALGLQERSRRALLAALPPVALGHALSIGIVVTLLWLAQASLPIKVLRYSAATILFGFGLYRFRRSRHIKWVGMRVGFRDLTLWSFLTASAHGAGLMLVPLLLGLAQPDHAAGDSPLEHMSHSGHLTPQPWPASAGPLRWLAAVGVHTSGHLLAATLLALLVYEKLGLAILRSAWLNLDLVWVIALMLSSALVLIL
jgi:hypothetical protein